MADETSPHAMPPHEIAPRTTAPLRVVLLVAHGSRNPNAAVEHLRLCEQVQRRAALTHPEVLVRPAYLEMDEPSIPDAIAAAVDQGASVVRLLPHFLQSGNHVRVDLPAIAQAARESHPGTTIELVGHLGSDPGLVDLLSARVTDEFGG